MKIVPMALKKYYIDNIPVEETIYHHYDILDFCKSANMTGNNILYERTYNIYGEEIDKPLSKTTRYYVSKTGCKLIKKLPPLENKDEIENLRNEGQLSLFDFVEDVKIEKDRETNIESGYLNKVSNIIKEEDVFYKYDIDYYDCDMYTNEDITSADFTNQLFFYVLYEAVNNLDISDNNKEYLQDKCNQVF